MKTIRDILERASAGIGGMVLINNKYEDGIEIDQALKEIDELLLECKPDEKEQYTYGHTAEGEFRVIGYNQAIDDYEKNIKKIIGGK